MEARKTEHSERGHWARVEHLAPGRAVPTVANICGQTVQDGRNRNSKQRCNVLHGLRDLMPGPHSEFREMVLDVSPVPVRKDRLLEKRQGNQE